MTPWWVSFAIASLQAIALFLFLLSISVWAQTGTTKEKALVSAGLLATSTLVLLLGIAVQQMTA